MRDNIKTTYWGGFQFNPIRGKINPTLFTFLGFKKVKSDNKHGNLSDSHSLPSLTCVPNSPLVSSFCSYAMCGDIFYLSNEN